MKKGSDWHPLHPLSPIIRATRVATVAAVIAVQQVQAVFDAPLFALALLVAGMIAGGVYGWISYHWTGFRVTHEQIELKSGVFFRQHRRIPLDRIEAIDIARPIVARFFGLVELRCEVVSGGGSEMRFQYLDQTDAEALREYVLQLRSSQPTASSADDALPSDPSTPAPAPGPTEPSAPAHVVLEVPASDVILAYGVLRITVVVVIGAIVAIAGVFIHPIVSGAAFISALPIALAVGVTTFRVVESFWGFRVSQDERGVTVRRGFLNELTQKVPLARIQAIRIEEPLLWRIFGKGRLVVDVAGYRNVKVEGSAETAVLAPVANRATIQTLLNSLLPQLDMDAMVRIPAPARAKWRAPIRARILRVATDDQWVLTVTGLFNRKTEVVPHVKAQSIHVTQGPWQRRLGLASLHIETAGSRIHLEAAHRDAREANELAWRSRDRAGF